MTHPPVYGSRAPSRLLVPTDGIDDQDDGLAILDAIGYQLDPWQADAYQLLNQRRHDGRHAASEVALLQSRQNGKTALLLAYAITECLTTPGLTVLWTAHRLATARETLRDLLLLTDGPLGEVTEAVFRAVGLECVVFTNGSRIRFLARSDKSGRGLSPQIVIFDEALYLTDEMVAALLPALSAQPDSQIIVASSAGDATSTTLARYRERGRAGTEDRLLYMEWCAEDGDDPRDPATWAKANPALGTRITLDAVRRESASMPPTTFARERLGLWVGALRPPALDPQAVERAMGLEREPDRLPDRIAIGWDVSWNREHATVVVAWQDEDGILAAQVVEHGTGHAWLGARLTKLRDRWPEAMVCHDGRAGIDDIALRLEVATGVASTGLTTTQIATGCADLRTRLLDGDLRLGRSVPLASGLVAAVDKAVASGWLFDRRGGTVPPTAPVALVAALHPLRQPGDESAVWLSF